MYRDQLANVPYEHGMTGTGFLLEEHVPVRPLPNGKASRLLLAITAGLVAFTCLMWLAVLLAVAGWLADLIWGRPPWSLLVYVALALTAAATFGYRYKE